MQPIGKLDRQIVIQTRTTPLTKDARGQITSGWSTLATVWAAVRDMSAREFNGAAQVQSELTTTFRIRYRTDVTSECRIYYGSQYYDITGVVRIASGLRDAFMDLVAVQGVKDGR